MQEAKFKANILTVNQARNEFVPNYINDIAQNLISNVKFSLSRRDF